MSLLEAHLAEYHLDDLLDVLAEAGIESIDDAMALEPDDLEALGCTAVQAIALRASFGHGGEGAQQMAASMAGALEAARTMSIRGGGAHHPLPTPGASTAAASSGGASWGYTADDLGGSELGVHLEAWGLISWAAPLLADSGIELIADVQTLTWSDLEHMGFGLEQAKQLRHSIGMDEAPPAEWAHRVESAAAAEQHEQREARARAFSRQQDLKKRSSIITEFIDMKQEDAVNNKERAPRQRGASRPSAGARTRATTISVVSDDGGLAEANDPGPGRGGELGADQRSITMPVAFGRARAESAAPEVPHEVPGIRVDRDGSCSPSKRTLPFGRSQSKESDAVASSEPKPAPMTSGSIKERAQAMQALADRSSK